jgi:hypothetical protein
MAFTNSPFGFKQLQGTGSSPTFEITTLANGGIDYNAAAIYYGDPVARAGSGDGTIVRAAGSAGNSTVTMVGIFYGCKYLSTSQKRTVWGNYWPATDVAVGNQSTIEAYICNDPNAQFLVQSDSTGIAQADVGANNDFNIGTGTTSNGLSGAFLIHGGSVNAGYPFRLVSLWYGPPGANGATSFGTTAATAYNYAVVAFNNVETKNLTAINT